MKKLGLLAAMAGIAAMATDTSPMSYYEEKPKNSSMTDEEKAKANGLKKFDYGNNHVFALNKKSADKKAKKLGYIPA